MRKKTTVEKYGLQQLARANRNLEKVKLSLMKVSKTAQREIRPHRVSELLSNFDPDQLGTPELSKRDGWYYIMDGQHRIEAAKLWLGEGWQEQVIECWVAMGLTEEQEAQIFLQLNDRLAVDTFHKYKVGISAGYPREVAIETLVRNEGLNVTKQKIPGAVSCVATLLKVYDRDGADAFSRSLRIVRDAFGDSGFSCHVVDGFGQLCHRYNGQLSEKIAVEALSNTHGGVNGILNTAESLKLKSGSSKASCVAAAVVQVYNRASKVKLVSWFKTNVNEAEIEIDKPKPKLRPKAKGNPYDATDRSKIHDLTTGRH